MICQRELMCIVQTSFFNSEKENAKELNFALHITQEYSPSDLISNWN